MLSLREVSIERVVWGRDREKQFSDRLALEYRIEVAAGSEGWRLVHLPLRRNDPLDAEVHKWRQDDRSGRQSPRLAESD